MLAFTTSSFFKISSLRSIFPSKSTIFTSAPYSILTPYISRGSAFKLRKCHSCAPSGIAGAWSVTAIASIPISDAYFAFSITVEYACVLASVWVCVSNSIFIISPYRLN